MKVLVIAFVLLSAYIGAWAETPGSFRGKVVEGPPTDEHWLFVEGRNHSIRRVDVSRAKVAFAEEVPSSQRKQFAAGSLPAGTQVRVTAEQDEMGDWKASEVEVLQTTAPSADKKPEEAGTSRP